MSANPRPTTSLASARQRMGTPTAAIPAQRVTTIPRQTTTTTSRSSVAAKSARSAPTSPTPKAVVSSSSTSNEIEQRQQAILARLQALRDERGGDNTTSQPTVASAVVRPPTIQLPKITRYNPFYEATQHIDVESGPRNVRIEVGQRVQVLTSASAILDEAEKVQLVFLAHLRKQAIGPTTEFVFEEDEDGPLSPAAALCRDTPTQQQIYLERHLKKDMMKRVYLGERGVVIGAVTNVRIEKEEEDPEEAFSATRLLAKYGKGGGGGGGSSHPPNESGDFVILRFADGVEKAFPINALDEVNQVLNPPKSKQATGGGSGQGGSTAAKSATTTAAAAIDPTDGMSELDRRLARLQQPKKAVPTTSGDSGSRPAATAASTPRFGGGGDDDDVDALIKSHNAGSTLLQSRLGGGLGGGLGGRLSRPIKPIIPKSVASTSASCSDSEVEPIRQQQPQPSSLLTTQPPTPDRLPNSPDASPPPEKRTVVTTLSSSDTKPKVDPTQRHHQQQQPVRDTSASVVVAVSLSTTRTDSEETSTIRMSPDFGRDEESVPPTTTSTSKLAGWNMNNGVEYERLGRFKGKVSLGLLAAGPPPKGYSRRVM